jgi:quinoprotein glucose dehydrogenase
MVNNIFRQAWLLALLLLLFFSCTKKWENNLKEAGQDWPVYLGGNSSAQYSPLDQINKHNVNQLIVAWEYHSDRDSATRLSQIQCNSIIIGGVLYGTSPTLKVFALRAESGEKIWEFTPEYDAGYLLHVNRGVTYWEDGMDKRILFTAGSNLYALNAATGQPIGTFGNSGIVSLKEGLGNKAKNSYVVARTPGIIYRDLLIIGSAVSESMGAAPGYIRAFDARTGRLAWVFKTIPLPGEAGYDTWPVDAYKYIGGANCWAGMSLDEERGIIFCPTGSAAYDFWGGNRKGENLFANCILALNAETGERIWHFQTVHHDIWDRDLPAPPNLVTVKHNAKTIDAVAQMNKQGFIFLLDRETGKPLFPVVEKPVPSSDLEGEEAWPTQPFPVLPLPLMPQKFTQEEVTNISPKAHDYVSNILATIRTGQMYIPPSSQGTAIFPGFDGGAEWGGAAYDPPSGILYVNMNIMPWIHTMIPVPEDEGETTHPAESAYLINCATCHGQQRQGDPSGTFPSLKNIAGNFSREEISELLEKGKGFMPSFKHLDDDQISGLIAYLMDEEYTPATHIPGIVSGDDHKSPFVHTGYNRFFDQEGYPAIKPPWGTLSAVDLNEGTIKWQVPLGEFTELSEKGIPKTGTENYGGPVVTAGGLIFIGASKDGYFRAFDKNSGDELWKYKLPAGGYATPSSYQIDGKQYIVIACGGGKMGTPSGDSYIAFTLGDE